MALGKIVNILHFVDIKTMTMRLLTLIYCCTTLNRVEQT